MGKREHVTLFVFTDCDLRGRANTSRDNDKRISESPKLAIATDLVTRLISGNNRDPNANPDLHLNPT